MIDRMKSWEPGDDEKDAEEAADEALSELIRLMSRHRWTAKSEEFYVRKCLQAAKALNYPEATAAATILWRAARLLHETMAQMPNLPHAMRRDVLEAIACMGRAEGKASMAALVWKVPRSGP